jgi:hypothetical protein
MLIPLGFSRVMSRTRKADRQQSDDYNDAHPLGSIIFVIELE